jgi:hypothetical protein
MQHIITAGPRAYTVASFMLFMALALPFGCVLAYGEWLVALKALGVLALGFGAVAFGISRTRIVFDDHCVRFRYSIGLEKRVRFIDILHSRPQVLFERNHPVSLDIYGDAGVRADEGDVLPVLLMQLRLKPLRQRDVAWLLSRPELKILKS